MGVSYIVYMCVFVLPLLLYVLSTNKHISRFHHSLSKQLFSKILLFEGVWMRSKRGCVVACGKRRSFAGCAHGNADDGGRRDFFLISSYNVCVWGTSSLISASQTWEWMRGNSTILFEVLIKSSNFLAQENQNVVSKLISISIFPDNSVLENVPGKNPDIFRFLPLRACSSRKRSQKSSNQQKKLNIRKTRTPDIQCHPPVQLRSEIDRERKKAAWSEREDNLIALQ